MRHIHTFLVKIVADDDPLAMLHGQISEPASAEAWRVSFVDLTALRTLIETRLISGGTTDPFPVQVAAGETPGIEETQG